MQDAGARQAGDARVKALAKKPLALALVILGVTATALLAIAVMGTAFLLTSEDGPRALNMDFRVFWAAGRLVMSGELLAAFDMARLGAEHNVDPEVWMPWLYPPGYLLLLAPFGALPFDLAFLLSNLLSLAVIALAVRSFVGQSRLIWLAMVLAPAYMPALILGQNSLIWLAGLLAALAALRDGRPVLAGIFIGCLTLKPQLGLLIPVALLAAGLWRTVLAATATALLLAILPTLVTGFGYWPLLVDRMAEQGQNLLSQIQNLSLMVGPYYFFTMLGLSSDTALVLQGIVMAVSLAAVALLWSSRQLGFDVKAAGLLTAMLLSAPYLWYYETAIMAAIGLFLLRAGLLARGPLGHALLFGLWIGGGLQAPNTFLHFADDRLTGALIVTPVLAATLVVILAHLAGLRRARPEPFPIQ
jgi:hypothetical protein